VRGGPARTASQHTHTRNTAAILVVSAYLLPPPHNTPDRFELAPNYNLPFITTQTNAQRGQGRGTK